MTSSPLQVAKREVQDFFSNRALWVGTVAAGLILGLAGPFGTDDVMRLVPRISYWTVLAVATFLTGTIIDAVLRPRFVPPLPVWAAIPLIAIVTSVLITAQIAALNALALGHLPTLRLVVILFANVYAASLVISSAIAFALGPRPTDAIQSPDKHAPPLLLKRLPLEKRSALITLSAVDHYVEVTTTTGSELLLMRLSDAIAEAAPTPGLQVHRSHWVALEHIERVLRGAGKATLEMTSGKEVPVSRGNLPLLKKHGLLPE